MLTLTALFCFVTLCVASNAWPIIVSHIQSRHTSVSVSGRMKFRSQLVGYGVADLLRFLKCNHRSTPSFDVPLSCHGDAAAVAIGQHSNLYFVCVTVGKRLTELARLTELLTECV